MRFSQIVGLGESLHNPPQVGDFKRQFNDPKIVSNVQGQAGRKNPAWKKSLVKSMKVYGFDLVGAGINGAVFANPKYPYVLKVYRKDEGFDEWLHFIYRNRANPYLPKLRGHPIRLNDVFTAIRMEPLVACAPDRANALADRIDQIERTLYGRAAVDDSDPDLLAIAKLMRDWEGHTDLSAHNIMCRPDGQILVVDPIYVIPDDMVMD